MRAFVAAFLTIFVFTVTACSGDPTTLGPTVDGGTLAASAAKGGKGGGGGGGGGGGPIVLPVLPGASGGGALGVNNLGEIVGYSNLGGYLHPTYWSSVTGAPEDLGLPDGVLYARARSISDQGHIVGSTAERVSLATPIQFRPGPPVTLEHLRPAGVEFAWKVNNFGVVSGSARDWSRSRQYERAVRWEDGSIHDIGMYPGGVWTMGYGLNDAGTIVGAAFHFDEGMVPYVWHDGTFTALPDLGSGIGEQRAYDIANNGDVVGASRDPSGVIHPVLWRNGELIDLGVFPGIVNGGYAEAVAVNEVGQAVGWGWGEDGYRHALLFKDGSIIRLPEPRDAIVPLALAYDLNDDGLIVGEGYVDDTYQMHPVVWGVGGGGRKGGKGKR
jgi:probable HAF family extracellular repeat protein